MSATRRLAAILTADVTGYSRLMAADDVGTLEALKACRHEVVDPQIEAHKHEVRFGPMNGHRQRDAARPLRAKSGHPRLTRSRVLEVR